MDAMDAKDAKDAKDRDWADPALDLTAVAAHAGYSRYPSPRAFKEAYGETPGRYPSRRRIERAEDMLRSADLSVTDIRMLVGSTGVGTLRRRAGADCPALAPDARSVPTPVPVPPQAPLGPRARPAYFCHLAGFSGNCSIG
ncbi:helix-turn-helix domain-containing protein [Streptomyces flavofungini]|uniref:helix-turn-helix domain-containing protein n=1 Tax=Streptomyces flavofungini TaxID=68200 RepID=UPI0025B1E754|nr:helix-turn-helix domain-containing protein [Streptomyces flavofungini]WJV51305.1 helix-turn-helix domain-containing protein [Streptomyces flavofungini]